MRRLGWAGFVLFLATSVLALGPAASAATLRGTTGNDTLVGTAGKDKILGFGGSDVVFARAGKDHITVNPTGIGFTYVFPGPGKDVVKASRGSNLLFIFDDDGQRGDVIKSSAMVAEIFSADGAKDQIKCGRGSFDVVFADAADVVKGCNTVIRTTLANFDLIGGSGPDSMALNGHDGFALGGAGTDTITGSAATEFLLGGPGADSIVGGGGNDLIVDDDGTPGDTLADTGGTIVSVDGAADSINCQNAAIHAFIDSVDSTSNCGVATVTVYDPSGHVV